MPWTFTPIEKRHCPLVLIKLYLYAVVVQMARDTEGSLGKKKDKERDTKVEKVVKKERPGMIWNTKSDNFEGGSFVYFTLPWSIYDYGSFLPEVDNQNSKILTALFYAGGPS